MTSKLNNELTNKNARLILAVILIIYLIFFGLTAYSILDFVNTHLESMAKAKP